MNLQPLIAIALPPLTATEPATNTRNSQALTTIAMTLIPISAAPTTEVRTMPAPESTPATPPRPPKPTAFSPRRLHPLTTPQHRATTMKVLIRTPSGAEEVREIDSDFIIPGDILDDGSVVLDILDDLSDDDYLAIGLYD